jgi:hypothetical protein
MQFLYHYVSRSVVATEGRVFFLFFFFSFLKRQYFTHGSQCLLLLTGASLSALIPLIHTLFVQYPVDNDYWQKMLREGILARLLQE